MDLKSRARVHAALGDQLRLEIVDALWLGDLTPHDLARLVNVGSNLLAHHLKILSDAGLIVRTTSHGDRRRRYISLNRGVLGRLEPNSALEARSVLFVCTHNSARSQFAEALMRERSSVEVQSAGTHPASRVHPKAIVVAQRHGLDLSRLEPKPYESVTGRPDLVVSVCDKACEAIIPFEGRRLHWSVPDPLESSRLDGFNQAFEEIRDRVDLLVGMLERTEQ